MDSSVEIPYIRDPGYFLIIRRNQNPDERDLLLRALNYCLHLPRFAFDVIMRPPQMILQTLHLEPAHRIAFVHYPDVLTEENRIQLRSRSPTLLFSSEDLFIEIQSLAQDVGAPLGAVATNQLSFESLNRHWAEYAQLTIFPIKHIKSTWFTQLNSPPPLLEDLTALTPMKLAVKFLARQIMEQADNKLVALNEEDLLDYFLYLHHVMEGFSAAELSTQPNNFAEYMNRHMSLPPQVPSVPLVLGSRSRRQPSYSWGNLGIKTIDPVLDESLYMAMLTHRTLACNGIGLRVADVPDSLAQRLRQLEDLCAQSTRDIPKIWWVIEVLGREAATVLGATTSTLACFQPSIALFSDFPFGLTLVDGTSSPLQFFTPVTYRPIAPLAAAVEFELTLVPMVFLRAGFRVLVIECLDPKKPIYAKAHTAWQGLHRSMSDLPGLVFEIALAASVNDLNTKLTEIRPDILIVSGHGSRSENGEIAGIKIGTELWAGERISFAPKLVILSACSVTPRSREILNIADLLLFQGVVAVIGTLVPIHFSLNVSLIQRFFQYIYHSILGNERFRSLDQAWCAALCGSVINDIIQKSENLFKWSQVEWDRMMDDYIAELNSGKIRPTHIYSDVEIFIRNYAVKRNVLELFDKYLQQKDYFPETMFYMLIGHAHRIILQDTISEDFRRQSKEFDMLGNMRS